MDLVQANELIDFLAAVTGSKGQIERSPMGCGYVVNLYRLTLTRLPTDEEAEAIRKNIKNLSLLGVDNPGNIA